MGWPQLASRQKLEPSMPRSPPITNQVLKSTNFLGEKINIHKNRPQRYLGLSGSSCFSSFFFLLFLLSLTKLCSITYKHVTKKQLSIYKQQSNHKTPLTCFLACLAASFFSASSLAFFCSSRNFSSAAFFACTSAYKHRCCIISMKFWKKTIGTSCFAIFSASARALASFTMAARSSNSRCANVPFNFKLLS